MIGWKTVMVETEAHQAETDVPVYSHEEFWTRWPRAIAFLGVAIKPVVRVKMGRAVV